MAKILLLGTWLATDAETARKAISSTNEHVTFGGLAGQIEVTAPRIVIERALIVNDRSWKFGMPRSVVEGRIDQHTDDLFVVVDEEHTERGRA